jgi:hypothetical protein
MQHNFYKCLTIPICLSSSLQFITLAQIYFKATFFEILITMRSTLIVSAFAALALAAPRPQDIDFDEVDATPDPTIYTPPTNVTVDVVDIQPASAASAVASAAVTDVASTSDPTEKRDMMEIVDQLKPRTADCGALPDGSGPAVNK